MGIKISPCNCISEKSTSTDNPSVFLKQAINSSLVKGRLAALSKGCSEQTSTSPHLTFARSPTWKDSCKTIAPLRSPCKTRSLTLVSVVMKTPSPFFRRVLENRVNPRPSALEKLAPPTSLPSRKILNASPCLGKNLLSTKNFPLTTLTTPTFSPICP